MKGLPQRMGLLLLPQTKDNLQLLLAAAAAVSAAAVSAAAVSAAAVSAAAAVSID